MGYSESSKAYRIYFPRFKKIDISSDVTFDKDSAYNKSKKRPVEDLEESKVKLQMDLQDQACCRWQHREI